MLPKACKKLEPREAMSTLPLKPLCTPSLTSALPRTQDVATVLGMGLADAGALAGRGATAALGSTLN